MSIRPTTPRPTTHASALGRNLSKPLAAGALSLALLAPVALAQDRADIERTPIIGNRELPKVLYVVPWKKPLPGTLSGRPVASVLDEALAPLDREVLRRQIAYHAQATAPAAAPAAPAAVPAPNPSR